MLIYHVVGLSEQNSSGESQGHSHEGILQAAEAERAKALRQAQARSVGNQAAGRGAHRW